MMLMGADADGLIEDATMLLEKCVAATPKVPPPRYFHWRDVLAAVQVVQLNRVEMQLRRMNDLSEGQ